MDNFSVCYIAKNEEENIKKSLQGLISLLGKPADSGYEILVLDTGSTDKTVEIARNCGARVEHFEWCDDFSAARNEAMKRAVHDRILFIDADEIPEKADIKEIKQLWNKYPEAIGRFERRNRCNSTSGGECILVDRVERFFDRRLYRYEGIIHEQVVRKNKGKLYGYPIPFTVYHEGYYGTGQQLKEKAERNNELLFKELTRNPDDPYIYYQIGQSYELSNDSEKALEYYGKGYRLDPERDVDYAATMIHHFGCLLTDMGRHDEALKLIADELPNYSSFADFLCFAGYTCTKVGDLEKAIEFYNKAYGAAKAGIEGSADKIPSYNLGCIYEALGDELKARKYFEQAGDYGEARSRLKALVSADFEKKSNEKYVSIIIPVMDSGSNLEEVWACIREQSIGIGHLEIVFVIMTDSNKVLQMLNNAEKEYESSVCIFYPDGDVSIEEAVSQAFGCTTADNVMLLMGRTILKWDALRMMNAAVNCSDVDMVTYGIEYADTDFVLNIENEQMRENVKKAGILANVPSTSLYSIDFLIKKSVTPEELINSTAAVSHAEHVYCIRECLEKKKRIKITVIIPCHNGGDYIDVCMNSLLSQTIGVDSMQIIIIDDASDDGKTRKKLRNYEQMYPDTILLILNEEKMGPGGCRNIAIGYALGEYVIYVDCDDWVDTKELVKLVLNYLTIFFLNT